MFLRVFTGFLFMADRADGSSRLGYQWSHTGFFCPFLLHQQVSGLIFWVPGNGRMEPSSTHLRFVDNFVDSYGPSYIYTYIPSASRTHKFVGIFPKTRFFFSYEQNVFLRKYCFFFTSENAYFFLHLDLVSWHLMILPLDDSNHTSLGSIPLSTLHVDYTSTPLALAGSSHKKGPDALETCRTTLNVITVNLELLEDFSQEPP